MERRYCEPLTTQNYMDRGMIRLARLVTISRGWIVLVCAFLWSCANGDSERSQLVDVRSNTDSVVELVCGQHTDCDDANACTRDLCGINGACRYVVQIGLACDDGDPCTQGATCEADGSCGGVTIGPMPSPPCFSCICDAETGMDCSAVPVGSSCTDLDPCSVSETCSDEGE